MMTMMMAMSMCWVRTRQGGVHWATCRVVGAVGQRVKCLLSPAFVGLTPVLYGTTFLLFVCLPRQGTHAMKMISKGSKTYDWFTTVYDNIDSLATSATHDISDADVVQ